MEALVHPIVDAIKLAVTRIPDDTVSALRRAYENEESEVARFNLGNILRAIEIGRNRSIPVCQDTGTMTFFVRAGVEPLPVGLLQEVTPVGKELLEGQIGRQNP